MDLSFSALFSSFLFGVIGLWMFREAKKTSNLKVLVIAIGLMVYSWFTRGPWADWAVGFGLCGLAWYFWYDSEL